ncbi:cugbp1-b [Symbiodinium natans]|uniref:Cugbp1-b protein n=1 Tax=Symbiodinium natans TaxID=878477 RepID=A0A812QKP9_9DINO|nr:cugbp1-b [Symbiodinium natans]
MNTQHTAMNKNLGTAAKQIFDLTHEEHKVLAEKIDGVNTNIERTGGAIDRLQESTMKGFDDAFSEFADSLAESSLLDVNLHRSARSAVDQFSKWHQESMHRAGRENLQQIEQAMRALQLRMSAKRAQGLDANLTLSQKREAFASLQKDANSTLHQLFRMQGASDESSPAVVDQEIKKLLRAAQTSIRSHHLSAERMGRRMAIMQRSNYNRSMSSTQLATDLHIEAQLVEFDKIMLQIRRAAEEYLEAAHSQVSLVGRATELTDQYLSECSSDFWELSLAARKALAAGKKAARSARTAMNHVTQQVGLLADMLVDGGLARHATEAAAAELTFEASGGVGASDDEQVPDEASSAPAADTQIEQVVQLFQAFRPHGQTGSVSTLLTQPELHQALVADLISRLHRRMPPFLPKALASFHLVQDLRHRHDMHGLARTGKQDAKLMAAAWARLDSELALLAAETRVEDSKLGSVFLERANRMLEALAPVPSACRPLVSGAGWATWGQASTSSWVLVKGAARLVQHKSGYHRSHHDFAQGGVLEAVVCNAEESARPSLRQLRKGELVVCFHNATASPRTSCTDMLRVDGLVEPNFWAAPLESF